MINSKKQLIKTATAILALIVSILFIYNKKKLHNSVATVLQNNKTNITQIKYSSGSTILEKTNDEGQENYRESEIPTSNNSLFGQKLKLNLIDKAKPNNIATIDTKVIEDKMIINFEKPQDNGTNYEYIIKNCGKERNISFYAKSNTRGYSYLIDNCETSNPPEDINKIDNSPIIQQNLEWDKDYYLHIRTYDNSGNYSNDKTFKLDLPSGGVDVKYLDINSFDEIDKLENIEGNANEKYDVSNLVKDIQGYQLIKTEGENEGILRKEKINILNWYAKNATLRINYIEKNTGKIISEPIIINGYEGKEIKIEAKQINGYTCESNNYIEIMEPGDSSINIYYEQIPKRTIIVKHLDKEFGNEIAERQEITDYVNTKYTTQNKIIEGYETETAPENANGVIKQDDEVIYYYKKKSNNDMSKNLTKKDSKDKNINIKYVDYKTNDIIKTETIPAKEKKIKLKIKPIKGYKIMSIDDFDKNETIIDELIKSLNNEENFVQKKVNNDKIIIPKNNSKIVSEYEIVMNCDNSDYIIYYKK